MAKDCIRDAEEDSCVQGEDPLNFNYYKVMKRLLLVMGIGLFFNPSAEAASKTLDGQAIFDRNCSVCHAMNPPPKSAPPIIPLVSRYRLKFKTKEDGIKYMAAFLKAPNAQHAVEPQAITRFGLMPPIALSDSELRAVAGWVWDQYNPAIGSCGGSRGKGGMNQY
jgi:cytochrome c